MRKEKRMEIVMVRVDKLVPYDKNPRENKATAKKLMKAIEKFGFKNPILLDKNNVIISGHARLKASMMLGLEEVPCIYAEGLSENEVKAFRIADNKTADIAGWDYEKLEEELRAISSIDFDMDLTGFNEVELLAFCEDIEPERLDKNEYKEYEVKAKKTLLKSESIMLLCNDKIEQDYLVGLFREEKNLKRMYDASELIKRFE